MPPLRLVSNSLCLCQRRPEALRLRNSSHSDSSNKHSPAPTLMVKPHIPCHSSSTLRNLPNLAHHRNKCRPGVLLRANIRKDTARLHHLRCKAGHRLRKVVLRPEGPDRWELPTDARLEEESYSIHPRLDTEAMALAGVEAVSDRRLALARLSRQLQEAGASKDISTLETEAEALKNRVP